MKTKKKSLQKLTEINLKINRLFEKEKVTKEDLGGFTEEELDELFKVLNEKFNTLKGIERGNFILKIDGMLFPSQTNQLWEYNHIKITSAISKLMQDYGRMPHKNELADETGLSRQTIHKHLKEYVNHPEYQSQVEQFRFMTSKVLARVFKFAVNGDIRAAKLYLDTVGNISNQTSNNTFIQQQNNYIQINKTVLSQESIKHLTEEQLIQIEDIIKAVLPQAKDTTTKGLPASGLMQ